MKKLLKKFLLYLAPRFPWLWWAVSRVPLLRRWANRIFTNILTDSAPPRPYPFSLWGPSKSGGMADYISWTGLVDRTYTGRHLPPASDAYSAFLDDPKRDQKIVAALFRRESEAVPCPKTSALFGFFAQWFTDSFLRTDPNDPRKNTSNHEIDLCQIYGLNAADTSLLRSKRGGELKYQLINGQEYPPYLFDGECVKEEFRTLSYINPETGRYRNPDLDKSTAAPDRKKTLFMAGLERGNSTIFYSTINTIFMREHNRLCREIARCYPAWKDDDDRLFETARNINIVQLLKIIIEDYINHLSSAYFKVFVEVGFAEKQNWYRTNRIAAEFDLLYRWHPFVPTSVTLDGEDVPTSKLLLNNTSLIKRGVEEIIHTAATQRAGQLMLKNTAPFLNEMVDLLTIKKSRAWRIKPYNEYRQRFDLEPVTSFEELTGDPAFAAELKAIYGDVNQVELLIGLFAEQHAKGAVLGDLMLFMVSVDAFSQALTNPLLSKNVYGEQCFSKVGLESIASTSSFDDIVRRNSSMGNRKATFSAAQVPPGSYGIPVLGTIIDTFDFVIHGWEQFFRSRQRKYGSTVFKANFAQPTIVALDHRAIVPLFAAADLVPDRPSRGFQFQLPPLPLVGDLPPSMYEAGPAHDNPKSLYMRMLKMRVPTLVSTFNETINEFTDRWLSLDQFSWADELEDFTVDFVFQWFLGMRPDSKKVRQLYNNIFTHYFVAITKYIPGSLYRRSLAFYGKLLTFVKSAPGFKDILAPAREEGLKDEDAIAKLITYVIGMNSFLGIQNLLKSIVGELSLDPKLCDELRTEMKEKLGPNLGDIDLKQLASLPLLDKTLREILRLHPPVFFISGRATRDRLIESSSGTFAIHKGELLMGVIPFAHHDASVFPRPDQFDPHRFDDEAASRHLIWPRGLQDGEAAPNNRTCPGKDVAVLIAKLFCFTLLTKFTWRLKDPQPIWDRHRFSLNVAAPEGALDVESFRFRN
jgi:prostaglandin-endoperoxide synthase 2